MTPASPYPLISTNDAFAQACHLASQQPAIGLDTEFVWT